MVIIKFDEDNHPSVNPTHPDDWMKIDEAAALAFTEMSVSKSRMETILGQFHNIIYEHLLKLFYFRDNKRYFNGWCTSVWKGLASIPKVKNPKGKDKWPDAQFIYNNAWGDYEDAFSSWHKVSLRGFNTKSYPEYKSLPYIHAGGDEETAGEFIKAYHIWLAKQLSSKGRVTPTDVQDEIKELLIKYPYKG